MKRYLVMIAMAAVTACGGEDKQAEVVANDEPMSQSKNSAEFNGAFAALLQDYYHLKDALVLSNDTMAITSANKLAGSADSLQLTGLNADSTIIDVAKTFVGSIVSEAQGLAGEKGIDEKRKSFQIISDNMYDLVRTVRYDRATVYHQFCPMAFDDQGAYWLSSTADIKNPYFGKKMLTCGEVKDSLSF